MNRSFEIGIIGVGLLVLLLVVVFHTGTSVKTGEAISIVHPSLTCTLGGVCAENTRQDRRISILESKGDKWGNESVFVDSSEIYRHYGNWDFSTLKTGAQIGSELGYGKCIASQIAVYTNLYASTDGTCQYVQLETTIARLQECGLSGYGNNNCITQNSSSTKEPAFGDQAPERRFVTDVICMR